MSEVQSRPSAPRGRGSTRGGGRGGFSSRGGARGGRPQATNGDKVHDDTDAAASIEDDGEVGQLKKKFGSKVGTIKEMFPSWTDEDVVFALQETDGDLEITVDRITSGTITQWGEVSKTKKDRSKSKAKDANTASLGDITNQTRGARGGRGGFEGRGGGRGRGADRGRGASRGGRGASVAHTNGSHKESSENPPPAAESSSWDTPLPTSDDAPAPAWDTPAPAEESSSWDQPAATQSSSRDSAPAAPSTATATVVQAASSIIPEGVKKSWASIFAPAPVPKKAPEPVVEKPQEPVKEDAVDDPVEVPVKKEEEVVVESPPTPVEEEVIPSPIQEKVEPEVITPSKDELTETNLEQVLDISGPPPTATAASTAASSWDPRNVTTTSTPTSAAPPIPAAVRPPPSSGFQASALKATGTSGRTPSYQRRVLDQEEAVRMPGNREVDRAAVQFGAFNIGSSEEDVDGEREEPETRTQPPQHSPVAPRAALPPAPQQAAASVPETLPTPKQAPGLPAATHPVAAPGLPSPAPLQSAPGIAPQSVGQFGRYGQAPGGQESSSLPQKPYDAFSQQGLSTQSPFEGYTNPPQSHSQSQQPPTGAPSSTPGEFSSYYGNASEQQRQAYNNYYQQQYGSQQGQQQEGPASQQRTFSGYGPQSDGSPFPQSAAQQAPSRYATAGEGQNSGHNTPNPVAQSQQQTSQGTLPQQPGHPQQPQAGGYPYGHPYYSSPYYAAYVNQYQQYGAGYQNAPYGGKGPVHQQSYQGYGMSPGAPYEHSSSPAGAAFGGGASLHGRDGASGGDYGRAGSAQASQAPGLGGSNAFGGSHDTFGRNSGYGGQGGYNAQQGIQQGSTDDLKPFGDAKSASGPSPSMAHAGRPGSATNTAPGSGLPPPQSQQYGGYPHAQQGHGIHGNQANSQYSAVGGGGGHQAGQGHQNSPYAGYGAGFGNGYGGGAYGNSQQQQRGGWGGNYGH